jgi:hypothetical protein
MRPRILQAVVAVIATIFLCEPNVSAQQDASPNSFYVAAHSVSDAAPFWFEYLLNVEPEGSGSRVRHLRLAPASASCPHDVTIRGIERVLNAPPNQVANDNLCSITTEEFTRSISRFSRGNVLIFDTVAYTINVSCGTGQKRFDVPYLESLDLDGLRKQAPGVAKIVDLYSFVEKEVFRTILSTE